MDEFSKMGLAPFDDAAATVFNDLDALEIRIGSRDLKIASIAIAQDALLLLSLIHI